MVWLHIIPQPQVGSSQPITHLDVSQPRWVQNILSSSDTKINCTTFLLHLPWATALKPPASYHMVSPHSAKTEWGDIIWFPLILPEPLGLSFWFQAPQLYPQLHIHSPQIIHRVSQHLYLNPDRFSGQICTIAVVMQKNSNTWATKTKRTKQLVDCFFKNCLLRDKMRYFLWPSMCWIKNQTIKTAVWLLFI